MSPTVCAKRVSAAASMAKISMSRRLFRAQLIAPFLPATAFAEVCDKERPNWTPGTETTAITEAIALFLSAPALILLVATAICFRFKSQWGAVAVVVLWTILVSLVAFVAPADPTGVHQLAILEGCIGSPSLFIAIVAALSVALILYTAPRAEKSSE